MLRWDHPEHLPKSAPAGMNVTQKKSAMDKMDSRLKMHNPGQARDLKIRRKATMKEISRV